MSKINIPEALFLLNNHHVVAIPTETVYGLAARYDDEVAIEKIFAEKKRPKSDPLIVHVGHRDQVKELIKSPHPFLLHLMDEFWPGPLTLLAYKKKSVLDIVTANSLKVAIRMPSHPVALEILQKLNIPLVAPSANLFGHTSPTTFEHVEKEFKGTIPIVDGGPCTQGIESTILEFQEISPKKAKIILHRPGPLTASMIEKEIIKFPHLNISIEEQFSSLQAPGTMESHYAPRIPLYLIDEGDDDGHEIKLPMKAAEAAEQLYALLREGEESQKSYLWIKKRPLQEYQEDPLWASVWNRLLKASSPLPS